MRDHLNYQKLVTSVKMGYNEEVFNQAMQLISSTSLPMVLVNIMKLKVLEAIAEATPDAQISSHEIASRLSISNKDAPDMIDRMLRLLATHSIVTCSEGEHESRPVRLYGLAPVAKYFITNKDGASLGPLMELDRDKVFNDSWYKVKDSVIEGGVAFDKVHGRDAFGYMGVDVRFKEVFNKAMMNHTSIVMKEILECYHDGFDNLLKCVVVDVGGGLGININMIVSKYPTIKGINFDLPHVTRHAPLYHGIEHVGGDMFEKVPQGDAIFMKWILHDWSDDDCVKLLKSCYKALPAKGKVIVVEAILPFLPDSTSAAKITSQMDALILTQFSGARERTEDEFLVLAKDAGFKGIQKKCLVCNLWVMEFYK